MSFEEPLPLEGVGDQSGAGWMEYGDQCLEDWMSILENRDIDSDSMNQPEVEKTILNVSGIDSMIITFELDPESYAVKAANYIYNGEQTRFPFALWSRFTI